MATADHATEESWSRSYVSAFHMGLARAVTHKSVSAEKDLHWCSATSFCMWLHDGNLSAGDKLEAFQAKVGGEGSDVGWVFLFKDRDSGVIRAVCFSDRSVAPIIPPSLIGASESLTAALKNMVAASASTPSSWESVAGGLLVLKERFPSSTHAAAIQCFLMNQTSWAQGWTDALSAWIEYGGCVTRSLPTPKQLFAADYESFYICDTNRPCRECRKAKRRGSIPVHQWIRFIQNLVGSPADILQPVTFSQGIHDVWEERAVPTGHILHPDDDPNGKRGVPIFAVTDQDLMNFPATFRRVDPWLRVYGVVKLCFPPSMTDNGPMWDDIEGLGQLPGSRASASHRKFPAMNDKGKPASLAMNPKKGKWAFFKHIQRPSDRKSVREWLEENGKQGEEEILRMLAVEDQVRQGPENGNVAERSGAEMEGGVDVGGDLQANRGVAQLSAKLRTGRNDNVTTEYLSDGSVNLVPRSLRTIGINSQHELSSFYTAERAQTLLEWTYGRWDKGGTMVYGMDISGSLTRDKNKPLYLRRIGDILSKSVYRSGINRPNLYLGCLASVFLWHSEDADLYSTSLHHGGAPKIWWAVPMSHYEDFMTLVDNEFGDGSGHAACPHHLRHKAYLLTPTFLRSKGIPCHAVRHLPGELMITGPKGLHAGANLGVNIAEAVNLAQRRWFDSVRADWYCDCRYRTPEGCGGEHPLNMLAGVCGIDYDSDESDRVESKKGEGGIENSFTGPVRGGNAAERLGGEATGPESDDGSGDKGGKELDGRDDGLIASGDESDFNSEAESELGSDLEKEMLRRQGQGVKWYWRAE